MKKKAQKQAVTPEAKARKRAGTPEAKEWGAWLRDIRKIKLTSPGKKAPGISQKDLAKRLGVERSTIASWENGDYSPSAESLIKLGNELSFPEAFDPWQRAGLNVARLRLWTAAVAPETFRLTFGLFPFEAGDVVAVDDSAIDDIWTLLGTLVVVEFSRYPARLEVDLSQREVQRLLERGTKVELAELEKQESSHRELKEQECGQSTAGRALRDDAQRAFKSKLAKGCAPDEHGFIGLRHIQAAGWLRLKLADDPDLTIPPSGDLAASVETTGPWQLVLQGASVRGVIHGLNVPLTDWEISPMGRKIKLHEGRILGRVSYWMRATGSRVL